MYFILRYVVLLLCTYVAEFPTLYAIDRASGIMMPAMKGLDPANLRANLRKTTPDSPRKVCYTIISYVCVCVCVLACRLAPITVC